MLYTGLRENTEQKKKEKRKRGESVGLSPLVLCQVEAQLERTAEEG
jgi:hypothetical protein